MYLFQFFFNFRCPGDDRAPDSVLHRLDVGVESLHGEDFGTSRCFSIVHVSCRYGRCEEPLRHSANQHDGFLLKEGV